MAIDYRRLRSVTAREIVNGLLADGFVLRRQKGSHQRYQHDDGRVTVSFHAASDSFPIGTLKNMIERQAKWTKEDLERLGLAK